VLAVLAVVLLLLCGGAGAVGYMIYSRVKFAAHEVRRIQAENRRALEEQNRRAQEAFERTTQQNQEPAQ
jgi:hypothetical protein